MFLRLLCDENGKPVFTYGELSVLFGGNSRQAASGHVERFRKCGSDFLNFLTRIGFFTVVSAKRELILFIVMYVFICQPESGKAPIESIMPDAREIHSTR